MDIRPFDPQKDQEALKDLFQNYPHKAYQQKKQALEKNQLTDFFANQLIQQALGPNANANLTLLGCDSEDEPFAMASIQPSSWHTDHFSIPMGKIQPLLFLDPKKNRETSAEGVNVRRVFLQTLLQHARERGLQHLSCRVDAEDWPMLHALESSGFQLVDCSHKLWRALQNPSNEIDAQITLRIEPPTEEDAKRIKSIATAHHHNAFFVDPWLDHDVATDLFIRWTDLCLRGRASHVHVARLEQETIGFVIYMESKSFNECHNLRVGVLDFMVLDPRFQGQGLGLQTLQASLASVARHYDQIELRTTHTNLPALSLYTRCGFQIIGSDMRFHILLD